jgi:hypothetical protein
MVKQYYYQDEGKALGPFSKEEIIAKGLKTGTYVWYPGLETWVRIEAVSDLQKPKQTRSNKNMLAIITSSIVILLFIIGLIMNFNNERTEIRNMSYVDPSIDFSMYVDKFYRDLEVYGIRAVRPETIIIKFARLETTNKYKGYNGVSFGYNNDDIIEIYINPLSWEQGSKARRYWLMYHELAHDILNAEHVEAIPENKGKLMYPHSSNFKISDMDEFIEAYQALFEEYSNRKK